MQILLKREYRAHKIKRAQSVREHRAFHLAQANSMREYAEEMQKQIDNAGSWLDADTLERANAEVTNMRAMAIAEENKKCMDRH